MTTDKRWNVDILITEVDRQTKAEARLHSPEITDHVGVGEARRNPQDPEVPQIGDELATSRALSDLAHQLLDAAVHDIESATNEPSRLEA